MKKRGAITILRAVTNPLQIKSLVRGAWVVVVAAGGTGCGGRAHLQQPTPTTPLPTARIAAQQVAITPLTLVVADDSLHWQAQFGERRAALARADSLIGALLQERAPEVTWLGPDELRRAARHAPGIAADPDQMGTAVLLRPGRGEPEIVPDPLRNELRTLAALAGSGGGRYMLVPAGLVFRRMGAPDDGRAGMAELSVVMVDVRTGRVAFRTVARGGGDDPWTALTRAVKSLTPGLP